MKYNIIKSETWLRTDIDEQNKILNDTINEFLESDHKVISVQLVEENGLKRFWIYTENPNSI